MSRPFKNHHGIKAKAGDKEFKGPNWKDTIVMHHDDTPGKVRPVPAGFLSRLITPPPIDPWAHRSDGMRCKTCMWFVDKGKLGRCRRHAPTMNGYPVVYNSDWCGDHKADETKVA